MGVEEGGREEVRREEVGREEGEWRRWEGRRGKEKPHPCIVFTLVGNCNVKRCRDRAF